MKKIICVLICVVFLFALCSCDRKALETFNDCTPEEIYDQAMQNIAGLSNYEIVHEQTVTTTAMVVFKYKIEQTVTIKVDGNNFYQLFECKDQAVMDQFEIPECWYVDEYFYADYTEGRLVKQHFSPESLSGGLYDFSNGDGILLNVPDEMLKSSSFYKQGGEVYLEIILDGREHAAVLMENGQLDIDLDAIEDVTYRVYFHDDGKVDRITTTYEFDMVQDGVPVKAKVEQVSTVKNIGTTSVELPDDAATAEDGYWFYIK